MLAVVYLRSQAEKCRELARETDDPRAVANLLKLAEQYDAEARRLKDERQN